jgi:pimeloyl-ACP methyl ester carboxylesterase
MPTALINGAKIYYEIIGHNGPWVAAIPGGRHALSEIEELTRAIASRGYRVIVHDRRNCGRSSLDFNTLQPEDDVWVHDLYALQRYLDVSRTFVVGKSRGARIAIRFALSYPDKTSSLGLWGLGGGAAAANFLDGYYHGQYLRACEEGGMEAVSALGHFAGLVAARPENRHELLAMDPRHFVSAMSRWRSQLLPKINQPVMGLSDEELCRISVPTAIVPYYDWMHPYTSATHALKMIPGSRLFDYDPGQRRRERILPRALRRLRRIARKLMNAAKFDDDAKVATNDDAKVAAILCDFECCVRRQQSEKANIPAEGFAHRNATEDFVSS